MSSTENRQKAITDLLAVVKQSELIFPGILEEVLLLLQSSDIPLIPLSVLKRSAKQIAAASQMLSEQLRQSGDEDTTKQIRIAISPLEEVSGASLHLLQADYRLPVKIHGSQYGEILFTKDETASTHFTARPIAYSDFNFKRFGDMFMHHVRMVISAILANVYIENTLSSTFGIRALVITSEMEKQMHVAYSPFECLYDKAFVGLCLSDGTMSLKLLDVGTWIVANCDSAEYGHESGLSPSTLAFFAEPLNNPPLSDKTLQEYSNKLHQALIGGIGPTETERLFSSFVKLHQQQFDIPKDKMPVS